MITEKEYYKKEHNFIFGVFNKGGIVFEYKRGKCSHAAASLIVGILNMAKESLNPGDWFGCDIIKEK